MKKIINFSLVILLLITFNSCAPKMIYVGDSAGTSSNVQEFYGEGPTDKHYKVLGIVSNKVDAGTTQNSFTKIKQKMVAFAKTKGADGIVYTSLRRENTGSNGVIIPITIGNTTTNGVKSNDVKKNVIEAKLIKF